MSAQALKWKADPNYADQFYLRVSEDYVYTIYKPTSSRSYTLLRNFNEAMDYIDFNEEIEKLQEIAYKNILKVYYSMVSSALINSTEQVRNHAELDAKVIETIVNHINALNNAEEEIAPAG